MTIDAIKNNVGVRLPCGRKGKTSVSRRERKLISGGKQTDVDVLCEDGRIRPCDIDDFTLLSDEPEPVDLTKHVTHEEIIACLRAVEMAIDNNESFRITHLIDDLIVGNPI